MPADWVASLPMYDFPELRDAHDAFWGAIAGQLVAAGLPDVPRALTRGATLPQVWGSARLLFAQGCEYPLAKAFGDRVRVVGQPMYSAAGCDGSRYRSAIVVRRSTHGVSEAAGIGTDTDRLVGLRGRRCVVNELDSNSGMNLLRAAITPLANGEAFFSSVEVSGSHLRSVEMVASGEADVAAIDCVSFAHFQQLYPSIVAGVRVLSWTASTPSLPYITAGTASDETVQALRTALDDVFADSGLAHARERLLLRGVDSSPKEGFGEVLDLERAAVSSGYPILR
jgi:ABC-type phosphate/phosphonate transport system substrate-binding protein